MCYIWFFSEKNLNFGLVKPRGRILFYVIVYVMMLTLSTELLLISKSASRSKGLKERQLSKLNPASRPY